LIKVELFDDWDVFYKSMKGGEYRGVNLGVSWHANLEDNKLSLYLGDTQQLEFPLSLDDKLF
jgi:hypothetical protein